MFASLGLKRSVGHSKALCSSSSSLLIPTTASPSLRLTRIGSRFGKGRTLSLGAKGGSAGALQVLGAARDVKQDSSHPFSSSAPTSPTVNTKFDSIKSPDGLEHHIRDVSQLSWIGVGDREWRIFVTGKGYLSLMQFESVSELSATERKRSEPTTGRQRTTRVGTFEFLRADKDQGQPAWILALKASPDIKSLPYNSNEIPLIHHDAPSRRRRAAKTQTRILRWWITTSYREGLRTTAEPCIPGGWIGRSWASFEAPRAITAEERAAGSQYVALRTARSNQRYAGIRAERQRKKEEEEANKKK
ncbi:hypothetical protein BCR35DRAFT_335056 [Leucosporidium creatinivorum]|uniref:Uncharacterized protein n=1 Tax=Leucosporidium creatinivorum TaxID=106004 RepID=A0A1Y2DL06_9BASI|nr:hypothetical protein BCR35DRAFT_335056 [Leucosporidium creatinivorum]